MGMQYVSYETTYGSVRVDEAGGQCRNKMQQFYVETA
jgi:hypothetical protein